MPTSKFTESASEFSRLLSVISKLRDPVGGCPWDRAQSHLSLRRYLIEETAEFLEAVESEDQEAMREELGDVLLQVVLHAQIAEEKGNFNMADVARVETEKMLRRHPHVFAEEMSTNDSSQASLKKQWEEIKQQEQTGKPPRSTLDGVPRSLPALARAQKILGKAAQTGFEWPDCDGALRKVEEELAEVKAAIASGNQDDIAEELGDLLFTTVNLCRWQQLHAEDIMQDAIAKFKKRFSCLEKELAQQGLTVDACSADELQRAWQVAKQQRGTP